MQLAQVQQQLEESRASVAGEVRRLLVQLEASNAAGAREVLQLREQLHAVQAEAQHAAQRAEVQAAKVRPAAFLDQDMGCFHT
jgi:hypothetical protein